MHDLSAILSIDEAAAVLGRTPATLRWAAQTGRLPAKRLGRDWVTTYDGVTWYLAFHRRDHRQKLRTV